MSVIPVTMMVVARSKNSRAREPGSPALSLGLYPTERDAMVRKGQAGRLRCWWAAVGLGCLVAGVACTGSDEARSDEALARGREVTAVMPSAAELAAFTRVPLVPADPPALGSGTGARAPAGNFWYRVGSAASDDGGGSFDWYVHATHLEPSRAYRLDLTVDGNTIYSIGSGASDAGGNMTSHGTAITRFTDQYCVAAAATPLPITGRHALSLMLKSDGSGSGPASAAGALTDPGRSYPCHGNGDGVFEGWLVMRAPVTIGGRAQR